MACFPTPPLYDAPARGNPLEFPDETNPAKLEGWGYRMTKISYPKFNRFRVIHPCDGQTADGRAIEYSALSVCAICCRALEILLRITAPFVLIKQRASQLLTLLMALYSNMAFIANEKATSTMPYTVRK